jgi:hypothetical protein
MYVTHNINTECEQQHSTLYTGNYLKCTVTHLYKYLPYKLSDGTLVTTYKATWRHTTQNSTINAVMLC